jgi:hypothetical protein
LSELLKNNTKYEDAVNELEEYMNNVFSEMSESISFDVFLKRLAKEIEKNTD